MKNFLKYWLPLLLWFGVIFFGSTDVLSAEQTSRFLVPFLRWLKPDIAPLTIAQIHFAMRKLGHVTEYTILAALLCRAIYRGTNLRWPAFLLWLCVWIGATLFAASDEFHQSFVPSRTAAIGDVMIDSSGAILGLSLAAIWSRRRPRVVLAREKSGGPERI